MTTNWVVETSGHKWWNTTHCRWDSPIRSSDCGDVPRIGRQPSSHNPCCGTRRVVAGVLRHSSQVTVETQRSENGLLPQDGSANGRLPQDGSANGQLPWEDNNPRMGDCPGMSIPEWTCALGWLREWALAPGGQQSENGHLPWDVDPRMGLRLRMMLCEWASAPGWN